MNAADHRSRRPASELVWFSVQVMALVAAFIAPFLSEKSEINILQKNESMSFQPVATLLSRGPRPLTMTSEVLNLPSPDHSRSVVKLSSLSRQIRFQKNFSEQWSSNRVPASVGGASSDWVLSKIRRKIGKEYEDISLVASEDKSTVISSVYLELREGVNEFEVVYRGAKSGQEKR